MTQILGVGNALLDTLTKIDNTEIFSELKLSEGGMTLIDEGTFRRLSQRLSAFPTQRSTGGSSSNAVLAASILGAATAFVGKVGEDEQGDFYGQAQRQQGVQPFLLRHATLPTGSCTSFVLPDGQRTLATHLGASATLSASDLQAEWFEGACYVFVEGYLVQDHALLQNVFALSHAAGAQVCLDLAAWNIVQQEQAFLTDLMRQTDLVFANEEEACALLQIPLSQFEGEVVAGQLAVLCGGTAIVKAGARGAWAVQGEESAFVPAVAVTQVVDTTAAGDFFAGGFLAARVRGCSLAESLQVGAQCAAEVIQVMGTTLMPEAYARLRSL